MYNKTIKIALAFLVLAVFLSGFAPPVSAAENMKKLSGTLSGIDADAGAVVIETAKGDIPFLFDDETIFLLGGKAVEPDEKHVGYKVKFQYVETDETVTLRLVNMSPPGFKAYSPPPPAKKSKK